MGSLDALREACRDGDSRSIRRLLTLSGPDLLSQDQTYYEENSCLWLCAERGQASALGMLVRAGWSVNGECDTSDASHSHCVAPLYVAAQNGHVDAVSTLVEYGAGVEAERGASGATALYVASQQGHSPVVRLLLGAGAAVDHGTRDGLTPLMVAAHQGHLACVVLLLRAGADPRRVALGQTVRQWAAAGGHATELEAALKRAANYRTKRAEVSAVVSTSPAATERKSQARKTSPRAITQAADDLERGLLMDKSLYASRSARLRDEIDKQQRGEPNIFTVSTVQEVEQIQTAWDAYKKRLEAEMRAEVKAPRTLAPALT